jgi:hypothetical protein
VTQSSGETVKTLISQNERKKPPRYGGFFLAAPAADWCDRYCELMPRVIRMPLQDRERAINLLEQDYARQLMRQGHLSQ